MTKTLLCRSFALMALAAALAACDPERPRPPPCDPADPVCRWPAPNRSTGG